MNFVPVNSPPLEDSRDLCPAPGPPYSAPPAGGRKRGISLPPEPQSARTAREFTAETMCRWGAGSIAADAVVVASELVANAIGHGTSESGSAAGDAPVMLTWSFDGERLTCVVTDHSSQAPVLAPPSLDAESGHGLHIVRALTGEWGWAMLDDYRKVVWAVLTARSPQP